MITPVELNNQAIALLKKGRYRYADAVGVFSKALHIAVIESDGRFAKSTSSRNIHAQVENGETNASFEFSEFSWLSRSPFNQQGLNCESSHFIYNRPIVLLPGYSTDKKLVIGCILFNVALSIHCQNHERGAPGFSDLTQVLKLYKSASKMIPDTFKVLHTVISYNAGIIYQELFQFRQAKACFELSVKFLYRNNLVIGLMKDDQQAMLLHISTFKEPDTAAAA